MPISGSPEDQLIQQYCPFPYYYTEILTTLTKEIAVDFSVPFGDMKLRYEALRSEIDEAVQRVLSSGYFILGPELAKFEKAFAEFLGVNYVVGCASGTEAIYLALAAAGVGPGDEVITVAHTAVPTISAISMTGAEPVFVDIDPVSYVIDVSKVETKITPRTKAILPVHIYGQVADMESLLKLGKQKGIPVIEDVAQATGAVYQLKQAGSMGAFGAFSFYPSKNLGAFGDGGAVSTNSKEGYEKLLKLRNYGQSKRYYHDEVGINSRLDEIQAAILSAQLPYVVEWNRRRREIARLYSEGLSDVVVIPTESRNTSHVYHLYVIQNKDRDGLQNYLSSKGIGTLIHYPVPAHLSRAYAYRGYKRGDLPVTELVTGRILSLPMFPELTDAQVGHVIKEVRNYHLQNHTAQLQSEIAFYPGAFIVNPLHTNF
jgi:dTDP-4-amino-4,6-dideoxygalactose transaminase